MTDEQIERALTAVESIARSLDALGRCVRVQEGLIDETYTFNLKVDADVLIYGGSDDSPFHVIAELCTGERTYPVKVRMVKKD